MLTILFDLGIQGHHGEISVIEINATLEAIYSVPSGSSFTDLQIQSFARSNGMLNVWPYWREYVQAATQRAGLAPLTLPLFRVTHKPTSPKKPQTEPAEK
jgi:preprotein translocase subunit SecB